jgi:superfamily II DNA or RNA helicase
MTVIDGTRYSTTERRTGGLRLRPYQAEGVDKIMRALHAPRSEDAIGEHPALAAVWPTGAGKGHPLDTEVPTPDGLRLWGDLRVGDRVYGSDGRPTAVTGVFDRGELPVYRITLKHGETVLADGDHLWQVQRRRRKPRVVETRWLAEQQMVDRDGYLWAAPVTGAVQREGGSLPLHPYVVGALLANGGMTHSGTTLTAPDDEVIERVRPHVPSVTRLGTYEGRTCPAYSLGGLTGITAALGIRVHSRDKRIPRPYLEAAVGQRIDLLHGLMDGDGSVRYHTTSPGLADDVTELVTSLGGTCSVCKADRTDDAKCIEYTCSILLPSSIEPTSTARKVAGKVPRRTFEPRSAIVSVEPAGTAPIRCITVAAPDSLYLITRNHIVTHNTILFSALGDAWHEAHPGTKILILAHRDELITQAAAKYRSVVPDAKVGIIKAERHEVAGREVVVASVQSLNARRRERLGSWRPSLLIIDECHHCSAPTYRKIIEWASCPVVGVTATMSRTDGKALGRAAGGIFDEIVDQKSILWMIRQGYLCDVKGRRVVVDDLDLTGMRKVGGDYSDGQVSERLLGSSAPEAVAKAVAEYGNGQPGVIFAPTVESAKAFTEAMRAAGFFCETVWGAMPLDRDVVSPLGIVEQKSRRRVIREFNLGKIDWLSSCMALTEGWDAPRATVAVIARATQSASLFIQMAGRVLRPFPGKSYALILDVVGVTTQHELATLAVLGGDRPKDVEGKTLLDLYGAPCEVCMTPEDECGWRDGEPCCEDCSHRPVEIDRDEIVVPDAIKAVDADLFAGSRQQWLQTYMGYWFLPAGDRVIAIAPRPDEGYDVIWAWQDRRGGGFLVRAVPDLGYAMAQGEASITIEEEVLARKAGAWRKRRATEKQVNYCKALKCYESGMESWKAGQVADKISVHKASARVDRMITKRIEG